MPRTRQMGRIIRIFGLGWQLIWNASWKSKGVHLYGTPRQIIHCVGQHRSNAAFYSTRSTLEKIVFLSPPPITSPCSNLELKIPIPALKSSWLAHHLGAPGALLKFIPWLKSRCLCYNILRHEQSLSMKAHSEPGTLPTNHTLHHCLPIISPHLCWSGRSSNIAALKTSWFWSDWFSLWDSYLLT